MRREPVTGEFRGPNPAIEQEVLAEQVRQAYLLAPLGIVATIVNSVIVFLILKSVLPRAALAAWLAALIAVSAARIGLVVRFLRIADRRAEAARWSRIFLAGLAVSGALWGSLALFPFSRISLAHEVLIAFVLGGMAAGAATSFSVLKEGYLAYSIPALIPFTLHLLLLGSGFHYAMAGMFVLYGVLLWRISWRHYLTTGTSLRLRFENIGMIERLQNAKRNLEHAYETVRKEIDAKLKAEAELRAYQAKLERTVEQRTAELVQANVRLRREVEERSEAEQALRKSNERLGLAEKAGQVGIFDVDLATGRAFWSEQLEELFGLPAGGLEAEYRAWARRLHPEDRPELEARFRKWLRERRSRVDFEHRFNRADGEVRWMNGRAQIAYREDGTPVRMIGTVVDSTERKRLEEEILHMVHHDTLTGLPNRRLFMDIIRLERAQAHRSGRKFALLFLDIDRFKEINDTFGHNAGDELLREVSERVRTVIRQSDSAARIGGDEFNIILADIAHTGDIIRIVGKIMDSFRKPFQIAGYEVRITTSIGISVYPDDSEDIEKLFKYADIAMYHAKESGRNDYQFYDPEINSRSIERVKFENLLRQTLARGELRVHYQPQIAIRTGRLVAAEALVRWDHPDRGLLESKQFVPLAESIGMIASIDAWVLKTACAQFKQWIDKARGDLCVAVNLSSRTFRMRDLVGTITRIMDETGLPPGRLEIEITESAAMDDIRRTAELLNQLALKGVGVSIDDFGTGYSSLNYLKKLPIQRLKIDQSFVKDIATDPDDRAIIRAVTAMAHNMRISVVAEGVETQEQLSFLSEAQCDEAQGYLLNKALPAEEFGELFRTAAG